MTFLHPEDWIPQGVKELEPRAWEALREISQSLLVTAGAGAGKTEFLAQKAAYLLQTGICPSPKRILAISFKRDAARNLSIRVEKRCSQDQARRLNSFTFDAFTKNLVDRFRAAIPVDFRPPANYRIFMPRRQDFEGFLERHSIYDLNSQQLERLITHTQLPLFGELPHIEIVRAYWREQFEKYQEVSLSFSMMNRLAMLLLRENQSIRRALHLSYPVIFLDEFQDTTYPQYELLQTAFAGAHPVFTAVGDDKQQIMAWAGAMKDSFNKFESDYHARRIQLICNWRSHHDLVRIQHVIATQIDPKVEHPKARAERFVGGDVAAIWQFASEDNEAETIAAWIAKEVSAGVVEPHDTAILVRMYANDVEGKLANSFASHGLRLRNVAREVNGIAIQDILSEELTQIILPILRLGSISRSPNSWDATIRNLQFLEAVDSENDDALQRLEQRFEVFVRALRKSMRTQYPDAHDVETVVRSVLVFLQEDKVRRSFPEYNRQQDFNRVFGGLIGLLKECTAIGGDWSATLDDFEGIGQVVLMTIHKSKGLEFHTIIFYGLDNKTWWSLTPQRKDELNSFFVAFTRARQRAFFTLCTKRGQSVAWLEHLLQPAGLKHVNGHDLIQ